MQDSGFLIECYPSIFGCDVASIIEEVGSEVSHFKKGDRVIANAPCLALDVQYAAFQSFVRCPSNVVCKLPDSISFDAGSVIPLAINTAGQSLFAADRLNLPKPSVAASSDSSSDAVFIYSGSSSVGSTAIQLAKAAGLLVATTASQRNWRYCRDLGADYVFDYKDATWVEQATEALKGKRLRGAFDAISDMSTMEATAALLKQTSSDGQIITVLPPPKDIDGNFGKDVVGAAVTFDETLAPAIWADFLPQALERGKFVPKPDPMIVGKGLGHIQKGLDAQRKGVSARKVVVVLD